MQHEFRRYWAAFCRLGTNMRLLLAGAALLGLGNGISLTFFNLYLKQGGLGEAFLGRLNSLGTIGSLALAIPAGLLVTRLGSRKSLVLSCALIALFGALQANILVPALLIVLQVGISASTMLYGATYNPEMMRSTDPRDRRSPSASRSPQGPSCRSSRRPWEDSCRACSPVSGHRPSPGSA